MRRTTDSWRVDETYVKIKGVWMYLYRAVDSQGNTVEFLLSPTRDAHAANRFFAKALAASHTVTPRVITVDKNAAYPKAFKELKAAGDLVASCELRQSKYLNNLVEQDHRFIKRLVKPGMGFFSFETSCAASAPLPMKTDILEVATARKEDEQWYTFASVFLKLYSGVWTNHSLLPNFPKPCESPEKILNMQTPAG